MYPTPEQFIDGLEDTERATFLRSAALGTFLSFSVAPSGWAPPAGVTEWIGLTDLGEATRDAVLASEQHLSAPDVTTALLCVLGTDAGPYIDPSTTQLAPLTQWLSDLYRTKELHLVWGYGHVLADTLATNVSAGEQELDDQRSRDLLSDMPQAVYQIGTALVGPYGISESAQSRKFPPILKAGPVPCGDPGCTVMHSVRFSNSTCNMHLAEGILQASSADYTDWISATRDDENVDQYLDDFNPAALPVTLANAFSESELRLVVAELFNSHPARIRAQAEGTDGLCDMLDATGDAIAAQLDSAALLQVLLLVEDEAIVEAIEVLIDRQVISIPPTEVRTMVYRPGNLDLGFFDVVMEVSQHGVCFRPRREDVGVLRLERLIRAVHPEPRDVEDLNWKLRTLVPQDSADPLYDYLRSADPTDALQRLVLHSRDTLEAAFDAVRYGRFDLPDNPEEFERVLDRLLWKVGFAVPSYPQGLPLFWQRLRTLREVARSTPEPYGETAQERIRAEAVNFFVSTEEILDLALSFSSWALLDDHYGKPQLERFAFNIDDARHVTAQWLNGRPLGSGDELQLRADDKNTLFPLVAGFRVLSDLCDELLEGDAAEYRRPSQGFPFYAGRSALTKFPFAHTVPLFDLAPEARRELINELRETSASLDRGSAIDIRNRLEHRRERFPSRDEIEQSLTAWESVVQRLETNGGCPTVFQFARREADLYGRRRAVLHNYAGEVLALEEPSALSLNGLPATADTQVWLRGARIAGTNESLRFSYTERSEFQRLWRAFPLRVPLSGTAGTIGDDADEDEIGGAASMVLGAVGSDGADGADPQPADT